MTQTPILSVSNLTTSFRVEGLWKPVVRNVSFSIAPKETVAVVGESGSGKSVTALSIMRLTPSGNSKIEGSIKLAGQELLTLPDPAMRKIRGNRHRHDLPGADDLAEPGADHRLPDHRGR
jgi:peptide/nickel transport system ATP-binding protein